MDLKKTYNYHKLILVALTCLNAIGFNAMYNGFNIEQKNKIKESMFSLESLINEINNVGEGVSGGGGLVLGNLFYLSRQFNNLLETSNLYKEVPENSKNFIKKNNQKKIILIRLGIIFSSFLLACASISINNFLLLQTDILILQGIIDVTSGFLLVFAFALTGSILGKFYSDINKNENLTKIQKKNRKLFFLIGTMSLTIGMIILKSYLESFVLKPKLISSKMILSLMSYFIFLSAGSMILRAFAKELVTNKLFKDYNQIINQKEGTLEKKNKKKDLLKLAGYFVLFFILSFGVNILQKLIKTLGSEFFTKHFGTFGTNIFTNLVPLFFFFSGIISVQMEVIIYKMITIHSFSGEKSEINKLEVKTREELMSEKNIKLIKYILLIPVAFISAATPIIGLALTQNEIIAGSFLFTGYATPLTMMICAIITGSLAAILTKLHKDIIEIENQLMGYSKKEQSSPKLTIENKPYKIEDIDPNSVFQTNDTNQERTRE